MPFIRISVIAPILSIEQMKQLQQGTTELMASGMRKPIEGIAVLVEHVAHGGWSIAGRPVRVAAQVDAVIGMDTNTPTEKSIFMASMMALLRSVLGDSLQDETYVVFHETERDSYGRGGLTRLQRDQLRQAGGILTRPPVDASNEAGSHP